MVDAWSFRFVGVYMQAADVEDLGRTSQSRSRSCSMMLSSVDDVFPILCRLIPIYGLKKAINVAQWSRGKILALGGFPRMQGIPGSNPGWALMFLKNNTGEDKVQVVDVPCSPQRSRNAMTKGQRPPSDCHQKDVLPHIYQDHDPLESSSARGNSLIYWTVNVLQLRGTA